jgi:hypothetical protein
LYYTGVNAQDSQATLKEQDLEKGTSPNTVQKFLKSIVLLLLQCQGSSTLQKFSGATKLIIAISHSSKLILDLFISDKSQIRQSDTSKLLQDMLLDIIVSLLEDLCGFNDHKK